MIDQYAVEEFIFSNAWMLNVFGIIFIALLSVFMIRVAHTRLYDRLRKTPRLWDDIFLSAIEFPAKCLVFFYAAYRILNEVIDQFGVNRHYLTMEIWLEISFVLIFAWTLMRFLRSLEIRMIHKRQHRVNRLDPMTVHALCHVSRISVFIIIIMTIMQILGIPLAGVMSFGALGGAGIAFASKDLLANVFGGLMIFWDRPFTVGDWVYSPEKDIEGVVEFIGWRLTRIRTFKRRLRYIPNAIFSNLIIENVSRMTHWRLKCTVGVRYDDAKKVIDILRDINAFIASDAKVDHEMMHFARFCGFGESSLDIRILLYIEKIDYQSFFQVREDILLEIEKIIAFHGAQCAFPTQTVHISPSDEASEDQHDLTPMH